MVDGLAIPFVMRMQFLATLPSVNEPFETDTYTGDTTNLVAATDGSSYQQEIAGWGFTIFKGDFADPTRARF